jgi:cytochrome c biogenesis factor
MKKTRIDTVDIRHGFLRRCSGQVTQINTVYNSFLFELCAFVPLCLLFLFSVTSVSSVAKISLPSVAKNKIP